MSMSQAIKSLADELKDTVFSHFQPKGVPQHFIGAAVIIGFAVVLLMARIDTSAKGRKVGRCPRRMDQRSTRVAIQSRSEAGH